MNKKEINLIIPLAGRAQRFSEAGYKLPKPLINVNGKPMIKAVIDSLKFPKEYKVYYTFIVREYDNRNHNIRLRCLLEQYDANVITLSQVTRGAAETCLKATQYIYNDLPLIITNCDQIFNWDVSNFLNYAEKNQTDGLVAVFESSDIRYSYIAVDSNNIGSKLAEKDPISNLALTGFHYWKYGKDFVESAEKMIENNDTCKDEFYVSKTYNYLINQGKKIMPFMTQENETIIVGTPQQLESYLNKI